MTESRSKDLLFFFLRCELYIPTLGVYFTHQKQLLLENRIIQSIEKQKERKIHESENERYRNAGSKRQNGASGNQRRGN